MTRCFIVPPYLVERLPLPNRAENLRFDAYHRLMRLNPEQHPEPIDGHVVVYDAQQAEDTHSRRLGTDLAASSIVAGLAAAQALWHLYGVNVLPCRGFEHYGKDYDNAFWDGGEMCFGDGDGRYFGDFTKPIDVCVHERSHGVTGDKLDYQDQAGALNESMSDVAGAVARQLALGLAVTDPRAWLIGEGLLLEKGGVALRDMLHPGTAYDTPALGRDPQPATMEGYVQTKDDDGGVHTNSSIPNRAFALAATEAGDALAVFAVWADVLLKAEYPTNCTFIQWAQLTVDRAPDTLRDVLRRAWGTVGVSVRGPAPAPAPEPAPTPSSQDAFVVALKRLLMSHGVPTYFRRPAQRWLDGL